MNIGLLAHLDKPFIQYLFVINFTLDDRGNQEQHIRSLPVGAHVPVWRVPGDKHIDIFNE